MQADGLGCAGDDGMSLIAGLGPCVYRGSALQPEQSEDLDAAILCLWDARRVLRERGARSRLCINHIRLPALPSQLPIGSVHFDDVNPGIAQCPRQTSSLRTRALNAEAHWHSKGGGPPQERGVTRGRCGKRARSQEATDHVDHGGNMCVRVRVHAADHGALHSRLFILHDTLASVYRGGRRRGQDSDER